MGLLLGAIADDFTGATDLANTLVRQGMHTTQVIGVPDDEVDTGGAEAVVVALKSRAEAADDAVAKSLSALRWLQERGAEQFFFKYCSTFDSTAEGNIGPVADALLHALDCDFAYICPAFPANGRTVYQGHLFVGEQLLSESPMKDHPLTPMRDANLMRLMDAQSRYHSGLIPLQQVRRGADAISRRIEDLKAAGCRYGVIDAVDDEDLLAIGAAAAGHRLVTGGSGVALGLPENFRRAGLLAAGGPADTLPRVEGHAAVVSGSCSVATLGQIEQMRAERPAFRVDPLEIASGADVAAAALEASTPHLESGPVLWIVEIGQQAGMDPRVERLHPAVQHLGKTGHRRDLSHLEAAFPQELGGAA